MEGGVWSLCAHPFTKTRIRLSMVLFLTACNIFLFFSYGRKRTSLVAFLLSIIFVLIIIALILMDNEAGGE